VVYSEEGPGRAAAPPSPLLAVPNVTAHRPTANVPTSYYSLYSTIAMLVQWLGVELCKLSLQASKIHFCIHKM